MDQNDVYVNICSGSAPQDLQLPIRETEVRIFFSCLFFGRRFGEVEHSRIVLIGHFVLDGVIKHLIEDLFQGQLNVIGRVVRYSASVDKGAVQQGVLDMRDSNSAHRHIVQVVCVLPFGNVFLMLSDSDIEALKSGKVLHWAGETFKCGIFVRYEGVKKNVQPIEENNQENRPDAGEQM